MMIEKDGKSYALDEAIEITKEYVRGGGGQPPENILKSCYEMINELYKDTKK